MWHCEYGKEPFDMRLFWLLCVRRIWVVLAGALAGMAFAGGIYYVKNVTLGGAIPYTMESKYYLEYAVDPSDQQTYSYFASYTWNDLLKSEAMMAEMLGKLTFSMTAEELAASFEPELISDLRICYIRTTHEDPEKVREIDRVAGEAMVAVGQKQRELLEVSLMDRGEPALAMPDLRTLRACVLGAALGAFAALFGLGVHEILEERIQVPGTLARRYGVPVAGYVSREGKPSGELAAQLACLLRDKRRIGVTAVNGELDLKGLTGVLGKAQEQGGVSPGKPQEQDGASLRKEQEQGGVSPGKPQEQGGASRGKAGEREYREIPCLFQAPEAGESLREQEGVLLAVQAGADRGKAIEEILRQLGQLGISVDAMILAMADDRLIRHYLWGHKRGRNPAGAPGLRTCGKEEAWK